MSCSRRSARAGYQRACIRFGRELHLELAPYGLGNRRSRPLRHEISPHRECGTPSACRSVSIKAKVSVRCRSRPFLDCHIGAGENQTGDFSHGLLWGAAYAELEKSLLRPAFESDPISALTGVADSARTERFNKLVAGIEMRLPSLLRPPDALRTSLVDFW